MAFDVLYVSPHADDVALSAAAQVSEDVASGALVALLTIFEMPEPSPFGVSGERATRRAEDEAFAALAGVERISAGFDDAVARRRRYRDPYRLLAPLCDDETPLVEAVRARIESFVHAGCRRVVAPLGIGEHVDHQIVHAAARELQGVEVVFYEDTPYVLTPFQLARRLWRLGLRPESVDGVGVSASSDPTLARGSYRDEFAAVANVWRSMPLLDLLFGVHRGAKGPWWLGMARWLAVLYLSGSNLQWTRRLRSASPPRPAAASIVRGPNVAAVKLAAIAAYGSQWPAIHPTLDGWRDALEAYARRLREPGIVERVWRLPPTQSLASAQASITP